MTQRQEIKRQIFRVLNRMDGTPITDNLLVETVNQLLAERATVADISAALRELEGDGFVTGSKDEVFKTVTWTLTEKGKHKALQI